MPAYLYSIHYAHLGVDGNYNVGNNTNFSLYYFST